MADVHTKKQRSYNMSKIKRDNTKPELKLKKLLKNLGFIYQPKNIYGSPDFADKKRKIAIFADGCFWHKCPKCYKEPKTNKKFWSKKIKLNKIRDKKINIHLKRDGWRVLRFWEHRIKNDISECVSKIKNVVSENKPNIIDLFCGAGGMSYGFEKAGFNILLGIDSDENAIKTFNSNHKNSRGLCKDIQQLPVREIKKIIRDKKVDVIIGGPPCQGFSMAGKRRPNDPRNSLFREYLRIVKGLKPKLFVMENVKGLLSMKDLRNNKIIDIIFGRFRKAGYAVRLYSINTADYGVPQKRKRVFIIGIKGSYNFNFPKKTHNKDGKNLSKWIGLKDIILNKKEVDEKYFYSKKLIEGFKKREKINKKKKRGYGWQFLDINKPSYTISARYWKDGAEALIKYNNDSIRMLTPQECSGIQGFPKNYKFHGNRKDVYIQIGNAVPPSMAERIARSIRSSLKE